MNAFPTGSWRSENRRGSLSIVTLASAISATILAAVVLAVVDLYMTGHGGDPIGRPWIEWFSFVHLSRADVLLYAATLIGGIVGFLFARGAVGAKITSTSPSPRSRT